MAAGASPGRTWFAPAIEFAEQGFVLNGFRRGSLQQYRAAIAAEPTAAALYLNADGSVPDEGAVLRQPDLANTLEGAAWSESLRARLVERGLRIVDPGSELVGSGSGGVWYDPYFGGVHAIAWRNGGLEGAADPRRDGVAR